MLLSSEEECRVCGDLGAAVGEVRGEGLVLRGRVVGYGFTRTGTGTAILDFSLEFVSGNSGDQSTALAVHCLLYLSLF